MKNLFSKIIDFILPPRCILCGKVLSSNGGVCEDCFNKLNFIAKPFCHKCGHPFEIAVTGKKNLCGNCINDKKPLFRLSRSAIRYDDTSKNMIIALKFLDKTENAHVLANWMYLAGKDIFLEGVDVIVPVPLHYSRLLKRKYNQSALLAAKLAKLSGIGVDYGSLVKHKKTKAQVEFSGKARLKNLRNAFEVRKPENLKGKRVLLVDDVHTTGATLKECAKVLKKAGVKSVDFLTVCRTC